MFKELNEIMSKEFKELGMLVHACNHNTWEAEAGG